jgi:hypothetical protein
VYLCVLCGSENKERLFPYTLTDWFVQARRRVFTARYGMKFYTHNSSPLDRSLSPVISFWDAAWRTVNHTHRRHNDSTNSSFMCYLMPFIPKPTEVSANELCAEYADSSTRQTDRQVNCSCHACYVAVLQTLEEYHENTAAKISRQKWKLVQKMSHRTSPETRLPCTVPPRCTQSTLS